MKLLDVMYGTIQNRTQPVGGNFHDELAPWNPPDLAAEAQILVWKVSAVKFRLFSRILSLYDTCISQHFILQGIGYSVATWKPCFVVLSGFYLYVLKSEMSQSYQRCSR